MKKKEKKKNSPVSKPKSKSLQPFDYLSWIFKNIVIGMTVYFAVHYLIDKQTSYNWAYNALLKENYKTAKKYKHFTFDKKMEAKLGYTFTYWTYLRDNTPEDAVILFPTYDIFCPNGEKSKFPGEPASKMQTSRFLYPRKLVYPNEIETNRYGKQLTHVAIVNGWGYEYLEYAVANRIDDIVLPIKRQKNNKQITNQ
jgi:hypothetical protein